MKHLNVTATDTAYVVEKKGVTNYMQTGTFDNKTPDIIVIDNFYKYPDKVRKYALDLNYMPPGDHGAVGHRTESRTIYDGTLEFFQNLLKIKIRVDEDMGGWDYGTNGVFQWCPAGTPHVYHADDQRWAAAIYLTPDAPLRAGTSFFRHKDNGGTDRKAFIGSWHGDMMKEPECWHLDPSLWDKVDTVGNVYNRLVIWNARKVHSASDYFGDSINTARLFQLFFFDEEVEQ